LALVRLPVPLLPVTMTTSPGATASAALSVLLACCACSGSAAMVNSAAALPWNAARTARAMMVWLTISP
jgi:hypothetical protein